MKRRCRNDETVDLRRPCSSDNESSIQRLQDGGLSVFFAAVIPLYEKAKRIGIIKVKDELLTYPEIKSMMRAEKKIVCHTQHEGNSFMKIGFQGVRGI